jgi:hypothetical protein
VLTVAFSTFYLFSQFMHHMAFVMVSPQFLQSCIEIVCFDVGSAGLFVANRNRLEICMVMKEDDTESVRNSACSENDTDAVVVANESWREKANFDSLRTANPLSE